jgi:hypothetical protein
MTSQQALPLVTPAAVRLAAPQAARDCGRGNSDENRIEAIRKENAELKKELRRIREHMERVEALLKN